MKRFSSIIKLGIVLSCVLFFTRCTKEPTPIDNGFGLPNATETGANTFGCLITGIGPVDTPIVSTFISDNNPNDPLAASSGNGAWVNGDTLTIAGFSQKGSYFKSIQFTIIGDLQPNAIYTIDSVTTIGTAVTYSTCTGVSLYTTTSIADSGTIQLTSFDTVNKIVSGTFTCNFTFPSCDSTIYATLGRFDYKYSSK